MLLFEIDFQSEEAIYMQLRNQVILAIASSDLREGDALPPVRQLAGDIGINMHTVNKAYSLLRQEGFLSIDRRRGAVICVDRSRARSLDQTRQILRTVLAQAYCQGVTKEELHHLVDDIFDEWEDNTNGTGV